MVHLSSSCVSNGLKMSFGEYTESTHKKKSERARERERESIQKEREEKRKAQKTRSKDR